MFSFSEFFRPSHKVLLTRASQNFKDFVSYLVYPVIFMKYKYDVIRPHYIFKNIIINQRFSKNFIDFLFFLKKISKIVFYPARKFMKNSKVLFHRFFIQFYYREFKREGN